MIGLVVGVVAMALLFAVFGALGTAEKGGGSCGGDCGACTGGGCDPETKGRVT